LDKSSRILYSSIFAFSFTTAVINLTSGLRIYSLTGSPSLLSLTTFIYNIFYLLTSYYYGKIAYKRFSTIELILISFVLIGTSSLLMALLSNPYAVLSMNAFFGMGAALGSPTLTSAIVNYLINDSVAVTRYNILVSLGTIFGYLSASFLGFLPPREILILNGAIILAAAPASFFLPQKFRAKMPEKVALAPMLSHLVGKMRSLPSMVVHWERIISFGEIGREMRKMLKVRIERATTLTLIGTVVLFTAINIFFTPMPAYLRIFGYSDKDIYALYLLSNLTTLLLYDFTRKAVGGWEQSWRILLVSVSFRPVLFLLPLATVIFPYKIVFPILYVSIGATWAGISASLPLIMMMHVPPERKGESVSKMNAMTGIGAILGSFTASILSIYGMIYTSIVAALCVSVALYIFRKASQAPVE